MWSVESQPILIFRVEEKAHQETSMKQVASKAYVSQKIEYFIITAVRASDREIYS
jgi:hypothetical protein